MYRSVYLSAARDGTSLIVQACATAVRRHTRGDLGCVNTCGNLALSFSLVNDLVTRERERERVGGRENERGRK